MTMLGFVRAVWLSRGMSPSLFPIKLVSADSAGDSQSPCGEGPKDQRKPESQVGGMLGQRRVERTFQSGGGVKPS